MRIWSVTVLAVLLAACGSDNTTELPVASFAEFDEVCSSPKLTNDEDDALILGVATTCFFSELDAGMPIILDVDLPTVEGDSMFFRYDFDGDTVLIVEDTRLDTFGRGTVIAQRCETVIATDHMPEGVGCEPVEHGGFVQAS